MTGSPGSDTLPLSPDAQPAPPRRSVLAPHILFTFLYSLLFANSVWLVPLLVRLQFGSENPRWKDWETTLVTAAVPTFMMLSIFWNELLRRVTLRTYLLIFWIVAVFPLGCIGFVHSYWQLLACHIVATLGLGGWSPVNGMLLKHFYTDAIRGRAFAVLNSVTLASGVAGIYLVGVWLEADPDAFRIYFPAAALVQVVGVVLLVRLARRTGAREMAVATGPVSWATLLRPVLHMSQVLRSNRTFLRFENAYMTYGAAYMLCDALLPVLATAKLGMRYEEYATSTQVVLKSTMLVATLPMGWLLDRLGPVRISGLAFAGLALYPLLLFAAPGPLGVGIASLAYGLGMAGVQMGWMLGPVALAGTPEKVPQYVAIHATLVGVRGILFQGLGMLLYQWTGSFFWPLIAAAAAFLLAAEQMRRLNRLMRGTGSGGSIVGDACTERTTRT
jgi:MFS family permease